MTEATVAFEGFEPPQANFTRIPNDFLEAMSIINTLGEMKVVYYILRHTWGFQDDSKRITLDEFRHGRKRKDGSRLDSGTGLAKSTIIDGLLRAEEHGFIEVHIDTKDAARIKKTYSLRLKDNLDVGKSYTQVQKSDSRGTEIRQRSEKETPERPSQKVAATPPVLENDYHKKIYFRDKAVHRLGTVRDGPWEVECESCGGTVYIPKLDKEFGCLCGNQVFTLLSKKPFEPTKVRKPESVEAYYAIVKSRGVRYGANEDYEVDIANSVTDVSRWRQVIKEYIHPDFGGNPYAVDKMLVYYNENRLPGTRKRKEREALSHVSRLKPVEQTWTQEDIDRYERGETVTVDMEAIRREVKKGGNNES